MIDRDELTKSLEDRYPRLEQLSDHLFRGVDVYEQRPYAVRYFDTSDDIRAAAADLRGYQERVLSAAYFDPSTASDLRWNYYLYFLTSRDVSTDELLASARASIEADREYARKRVVTVAELRNILSRKLETAPTGSTPTDPLAEWIRTLEQHDLSYVVDEALQVPAVAKHIARGDRRGVARPPVMPALSDAEMAVPSSKLRRLTIGDFRPHPSRREFEFGAVNLISGVNGVGKTSLLEAIEYLFCGQIRRSGAAPRRGSVEGELRPSGRQLATTHRTPATVLRARHLVWYGKADLRAVKLDESFSKFNFLDTDAAARLTVGESQERLDSDLAQLLLGAEASKVLDRFERLDKSLAELLKDLEREASFRDARCRDAAQRLTAARNLPRQSDQLSKALRETLEALGWKAPLRDKAKTDDLQRQLQAALLHVGVIRASGRAWAMAELEDERKMLRAAEQRLSGLDKALRDVSAAHRDLERDAKAIAVADAAVAELGEMLAAGAIQLANDIEAKTRQRAELAARLDAVDDAAWEALLQLGGARANRLLEAERALSSDVERLSKQATELRRRLGVVERTQAVIVRLRSQLRAVAEELTNHTGDRTHCPLCATAFKQRQLDTILRAGSDDAEDGSIASLREEALKLEVAHGSAERVLKAVTALSSYPGVVRSRATVVEAIDLISVDRDRLSSVSSELQSLNKRSRDFVKRGWSAARVFELARAAGIGAGLPTEASLNKVAATIAKRFGEIQRQIQSAVERQRELRNDIAEVARIAGVPASNVADGKAKLSTKVAQLERTKEAAIALSGVLKAVDADGGLKSDAALREALDLVTRLSAAMSAETTRGSEMLADQEIVETETTELAALRQQVKRIVKGRSVIAELVERQSAHALTALVMKENGQEIATTFSKIHSPSEFDLTIESEGFRVFRRSSRAQVDLHEMSSGQRAAFAMSLFLAMNARLSSGPSVIMFDDPVAHVDDINTLSFLDHLRDIALAGRRQVFFATADSKLAGLFSRKFRFLGREFQRIDLTRE